MALYSVGTWDPLKQAYTPQRGLSVPSFNITLAQLRVALKELVIQLTGEETPMGLTTTTTFGCW